MRLYPDATEAFFAATDATTGTRTTYGYVYRLLQAEHPRLSLSGFTTDKLDTFLSQDHLAPNTVRNYRNAIRALFRWAKDEGLIPRDPSAGLTVKGSKVRARQPVWVQAEQIRQMIEACPPDPQGCRDAFLLSAVGVVCARPSLFENATWAELDQYMADPRREGIRSPLGASCYSQWRRVFAREAPERHIGRMPVVCRVVAGVPVPGSKLGGPSIRQALARRAAAVGVEGIVPDDLRRSMVGALWSSRRYLILDLAAAIGETSEVVWRMLAGYPWSPPPIPVHASF